MAGGRAHGDEALIRRNYSVFVLTGELSVRRDSHRQGPFMCAYRQDVLLVPVRVPEVQHYGVGEEDLDSEVEPLEIEASHGTITTKAIPMCFSLYSFRVTDPSRP